MSLSEAFKQLDCLNEDVFEVSDKGIEELKDFRDSDYSDDQKLRIKKKLKIVMLAKLFVSAMFASL